MDRIKNYNFTIRLFVLIVVSTLVGSELIVTAQNSSLNPTVQNGNTSASNMSGTKRRSTGQRRGRRRSQMSMSNANSACGPMQENSNMAGSMQENANNAGAASGKTNTGGRRRGRRRGEEAGMTVQLGPGQEIITDRPVGMGGCDPNTQTLEDLSGTYTGTINYSEGGMSGDATLTINGNDFTLTSGATTQEGRIVAVNTCKYIGATMMFGKWQAAAPGAGQPPLIPTLSLTVKKSKGSITLTSAPGERREFSFSPLMPAAMPGAGAGRGGGRPIKVGIKPPTVRNHMQRVN